jgi:hypothetical protein
MISIQIIIMPGNERFRPTRLPHYTGLGEQEPEYSRLDIANWPRDKLEEHKEE